MLARLIMHPWSHHVKIGQGPTVMLQMLKFDILTNARNQTYQKL